MAHVHAQVLLLVDVVARGRVAFVSVAIFLALVLTATLMLGFLPGFGWSLPEACYFIVTTLLTVGLGDYVPNASPLWQVLLFCVTSFCGLSVNRRPSSPHRPPSPSPLPPCVLSRVPCTTPTRGRGSLYTAACARAVHTHAAQFTAAMVQALADPGFNLFATLRSFGWWWRAILNLQHAKEGLVASRLTSRVGSGPFQRMFQRNRRPFHRDSDSAPSVDDQVLNGGRGVACKAREPSHEGVLSKWGDDGEWSVAKPSERPPAPAAAGTTDGEYAVAEPPEYAMSPASLTAAPAGGVSAATAAASAGARDAEAAADAACSRQAVATEQQGSVCSAHGRMPAHSSLRTRGSQRADPQAKKASVTFELASPLSSAVMGLSPQCDGAHRDHGPGLLSCAFADGGLADADAPANGTATSKQGAAAMDSEWWKDVMAA